MALYIPCECGHLTKRPQFGGLRQQECVQSLFWRYRLCPCRASWGRMLPCLFLLLGLQLFLACNCITSVSSLATWWPFLSLSLPLCHLLQWHIEFKLQTLVLEDLSSRSLITSVNKIPQILVSGYGPHFTQASHQALASRITSSMDGCMCDIQISVREYFKQMSPAVWQSERMQDSNKFNLHLCWRAWVFLRPLSKQEACNWSLDLWATWPTLCRSQKHQCCGRQATGLSDSKRIHSTFLKYQDS